MKRILCLVLAAALLLPVLAGCGERIKEPVTFYYLREDYRQDMESIIVGEEREVAGYRDNLKYLLTFYMMGPVGKNLRSPLPKSTILYAVHQEGTSLTIEISNTSTLLSDSEFSVACACLSLTCMNLVPAEEVTIISGSRSLSLHADSLTLTDEIQPEETTK